MVLLQSTGLLDEVPTTTRRKIEPPLVFLLGAAAAPLNIYLAIVCWTILRPLTRLFFS